MAPPIKAAAPKDTVDVSQVDCQYIRKKIYEIHLERKKHPTVRTILKALQEDKSFKFDGDKELLRKILIKLGFVYTKVLKKRTRLMQEKNRVILNRLQYVSEIQKCRQEDREIAYADETMVETKKGGRMIVLHADGAKGPLLGALRVQKVTDTEPTFDKKTYEEWLEKQLIPNLKANSVLAVNLSLLKKTMERELKFNSKEEIRNYLLENNVRFDANDDLSAVELSYLVEKHIKDNKPYSMQKIMKHYGHTVLSIPDYHPDFNVAEKMWGRIIALMSSDHKFATLTTPEEFKELISESSSLIPPEEWVDAVDKAKASELEQDKIDHEIDDYFDEFRVREKPGSLMEESYSEEDEESADTSDSE